jgi:hypothetical protein
MENELKMIAKYPATMIVHTAQGPEPCCDKHAIMVKNLFQFMGSHVNATPAAESAECNNCRNEARKP